MKHKIKVTTVVAATLLVLALAVSLFVPLLDMHSADCLYCGDQSNTIRLLGVKIWRFNRKSTFNDGITIPAHTHKLTDICGSRRWVFKGTEHWDTFGFAARSYRNALVTGIAAFPERKAEILAEYLAIDPSDHDAQKRFIKAYRIKNTNQVTPADGHQPLNFKP